MSLQTALAFAWIALGHVALWVIVFNRLHAAGIPCAAVKWLEKVVLAVAAAIPLLALLHAQAGWPTGPLPGSGAWWWAAYAVVCGSAAVVVAVNWVRFRILDRRPPQLARNDTLIIHVQEHIERPLAGSLLTRLLASLPGNEIFHLAVHHKRFKLAQLPPAWDGLSIVQLSDLHLAGHVAREYFEFVVERANELEADLVVVTGDIVDRPECIDWIAPTLGRLQSRYGVYCVLGNHDKRIRDQQRLRQALAEAGVVDLSGKWQAIDVRGTAEPLLLAGNALPWYGPAPELDECAARDWGLRILLSHSPDQWRWACRHGFDLMLAGHTHGGQIRLPLIGPVVAPSDYGARYASGVFYRPPTLLHVSRGLSGMQPVRWNCPPELAHLTLEAAGGRP